MLSGEIVWWRVNPRNDVCPLTARIDCEGCKFYMKIPGREDYNCLIGQIAYRLEQIMRKLP